MPTIGRDRLAHDVYVRLPHVFLRQRPLPQQTPFRQPELNLLLARLGDGRLGQFPDSPRVAIELVEHRAHVQSPHLVVRMG